MPRKFTAESQPTSPPGGAVASILALRRCGRGFEEWLQSVLSPHGLEPTTFCLLWASQATQGGLNQKALADAVGVSPALVSGVVEEGRKKGWLIPDRDPLDRRRQCWRLTQQGADLMDVVVASLEKHLERRAGRSEPDPAAGPGETTEPLAGLLDRTRMALEQLSCRTQHVDSSRVPPRELGDAA